MPKKTAPARSNALVKAQDKYRKDKPQLPGCIIPADVLATLEAVQAAEPDVSSRAGAVWWCVRYVASRAKKYRDLA